jgi:hypothetical protein
MLKVQSIGSTFLKKYNCFSFVYDVLTSCAGVRTTFSVMNAGKMKAILRFS